MEDNEAQSETACESVFPKGQKNYYRRVYELGHKFAQYYWEPTHVQKEDMKEIFKNQDKLNQHWVTSLYVRDGLKNENFIKDGYTVSRTLDDDVCDKTRGTFLNWFSGGKAKDPDFPKNILFTSTKTFLSNGIINKYSGEYVLTKPLKYNKKHFEFEINLWVGFINEQILGPCEIPEKFDASAYLKFLKNQLADYLDNIPLARLKDIWFLHDGSEHMNPAFYNDTVVKYLNKTFPNKWIGYKGPVNYPNGSFNLNVLDYFYWPAMRKKIFGRGFHCGHRVLTNEDSLRRKIFEAAKEMKTEGLLPKVIKRFEGSGENDLDFDSD